MAQGGLSNGWNATHMSHDSALSVGSSKADEDAAKIRDLEDEVKHLAEKANTACEYADFHQNSPATNALEPAQRFADYENEIRVLEAKLRQEQRKQSVPTITTESPDTSPASDRPADRPGVSRFGSFMGKKPAAAGAQQNGTASVNIREKELEEKLVKEQTTRIAAEMKVKEVNAEIEDLSATLFQQANEMVATERRENAALKERIEALEAQRQQKEQQMHQHEEVQENTKADKDQDHDAEALQKENEKLKDKIKHLEQREGDRKRRIERLEAANRRIERVRAMLQPP